MYCDLILLHKRVVYKKGTQTIFVLRRDVHFFYENKVDQFCLKKKIYCSLEVKIHCKPFFALIIFRKI